MNFTVPAGTYDSSTQTFTCNGTAVAGAAAVVGNSLELVPTNGIPLGATCSFAGTVTAKGEGTGKSATASWNITFQTAPPPVLHYDRVTIAVVSGYPTIVTLNNIPARAVNNTSYKANGPNGLAMYNCLVSETPQADGLFLELCQMPSDNGNLHVIAHDPAANVLTNFNGALPAGMDFSRNADGSFNVGPKWHACMTAGCQTGVWGTPPQSYMSSWAPAKEGGYHYVNNADARKLYYLDPNGISTLKWFDPNTTVILVMVTISN